MRPCGRSPRRAGSARLSAATERGQNRELYDVLAAVNADELEPDAQRVLEKALLEFRRSGVDLDESGSCTSA